MKVSYFFILGLICSLIVYCSEPGDYTYKPGNNIDFKSFSIEKKNNVPIQKIGKIERIVKLDTTDASLIGQVNHIFCSDDGDFYVVDTDSVKKVLQFNKDGSFIRSYGKIGVGPGEYPSFKTADILSDGTLVILGETKILKFDKNGVPIAETKMIDERGLDLAIINDSIYVSIFISINPQKNNHSILIFDKNLKRIGQIGSYDSRLDIVRFTPMNIFSKNAVSLFFIDYFDLTLNMLNTQTKAIDSLKILEDQSFIKLTSQKGNKRQVDWDSIKQSLHRFNYIKRFNHSLLLVEYCENKRIYDFWFLDLEKKKVTIYPYDTLSSTARTIFFGIRGTDKNSAILALDFQDKKELKEFQENFPEARNLSITEDDNPVLVLFKFNDCR